MIFLLLLFKKRKFHIKLWWKENEIGDANSQPVVNFFWQCLFFFEKKLSYLKNRPRFG